MCLVQEATDIPKREGSFCLLLGIFVSSADQKGDMGEIEKEDNAAI